MKKRILMIDDDRVFLEQRKEWLELEDPDFEVTTVDTLEGGRRLMREEYFHVITIDLGMSKAEAGGDTTGMLLVHDPDFAHLVKIVLTGPHNDVTLSGPAMSNPDTGGLPPAVDYLLKSQGPEAMRDAIDRAIRRDCKIDPAMTVEWPSRGYAADLVGMLEPDAPDEGLFRRGEELSDVLRQAFLGYDRVRVVGRRWRHGPRAALDVKGWRGAITHGRLVIVGLRDNVLAHIDAYRRLMPERAPRGHAQLLHYDYPLRTLRYAGAVFELPNARIDDVRSLPHFYADSGPNDVRECIRGLVAEGLKPWGQYPQLLGAADHADQRLRQQAGLPDDSPERLRRRIQDVGQVAEQHNEATLSLADGRLTICPLKGAEQEAPDPAAWLAQAGPQAFSRPLSAGESCGAPHADTILVARGHRSWLTDYGRIGHGPLLSTVAALEAAVLFELHTFDTLDDFSEAYRDLLRHDDLAQPIGAPSATARKPFAAIQQMRELAAKADFGGDMEAYHRALFYHAARRLLDTPDEELHDNPLRGLCLCLGLGLLAQQLTAPANPVDRSGGFVANPQTKQMWVEGRLISPTPRAREFLLFLWQNRDTFCPNAKIVEGCRGYSYSAENVHNWAKEARQALGPAADRYLVTDRGGYTLYPDGRPGAPPGR